jgi:hypothetical protein
MARLSSNTVHAPHTSDSHERLVPVSLRRFRKNCSSVSSTGTSPAQDSPLMVNDKLKVSGIFMSSNAEIGNLPFGSENSSFCSW